MILMLKMCKIKIQARDAKPTLHDGQGDIYIYLHKSRVRNYSQDATYFTLENVFFLCVK